MENDVNSFFDFLYEGLDGYIYLAAKNPEDPSEWVQGYYHYPTEADRAANQVKRLGDKYEMYVAPSLFATPSGEKKDFKATNVVWADFDGNAPEAWNIGDSPSLVVQTSHERNQHVYWRLTEPIRDVNEVEVINRNLAVKYGADLSGWDANQVLRPPDSFHHKSGTALPVRIVSSEQRVYEKSYFGANSVPEEVSTADSDYTKRPDNIPEVQAVLLKYALSPDFSVLITKAKSQISDRSDALMLCGYYAAEHGMSDSEIYAVVEMLDDRVEKFKGRPNRSKMIGQIVKLARQKNPLSSVEDEIGDGQTFAYDYMSFLQTDIKVEWLIEPMLTQRGFMLMVGPSGIGKTQFSLRFMIHLALGKDYLHYKIAKPQKVVFFSLEMDHGSLKMFLEKMDPGLSDGERKTLAENFVIIPHGEPWPLNTEEGQADFSNILEAVEPDVVFIDSIGSSIKGNVSNDDDVFPFLAYIDRIRKKYGLSVWAIHHMRKAQNGGNAPSSQDDVYGNQYFLNRASSAYGLLRGKNGNIKVRNFKMRLAPKELDYILERTDDLDFISLGGSVDNTVESISYRPDDKETDNVKTPFEL